MKTVPEKFLTVQKQRSHKGVTLYEVKTRDIYAVWTQAVQRRFVRAYTGALHWYLSRHPALTHEHPNNLARKLSYIPKGMRAWKEYMPGGFATFYAHNPTHAQMKNGGKIDLITRGFFKHTYDAAGLRSRSCVLNYCAEEQLKLEPGSMHWVSIAGGSGQPVYDLLLTLSPEDVSRISLTILDINPEILSFAEELYVQQGISLKSIRFVQGDIFDPAVQKDVLMPAPMIVDAMGLFEYLDNDRCIALFEYMMTLLPKGCLIVFTNMRVDRPELETHKRAVGWPGVIQRSEDEVLQLLLRAHVPAEAVSIFCPDDRVYNVYKVYKR